MTDSENDDDGGIPRASSIRWDVRLEGRAWAQDEFDERVDLRPEKLEVWDGKLLFDENERLLLAGLLIENLGADQIVRIGDSRVWREAVGRLQ